MRVKGIYIVLSGLFILHIPARNITRDTVKMAVLLPEHGQYPFVKSKTLPAIQLAVKEIEKQQCLPNHDIVIIYRDSECSEIMGPLRAIDLYVEKEVSVFLGPCCDYPVASIARYSPHWNIPVMSAGAFVKAFDDKGTYKLLTRTLGSYAKISEFVFDIIKRFNWTTIGLLFHDREGEGRSNHYFAMEPIFHIFKTHGIVPWYESFDENLPYLSKLDSILKEASLNTRIVVLCASADSVRDIMIKAHELNFDNGEYVFLNIDLFSSKNESEKPWYREGDTEERNNKAMKAYEALMTVTLRKPTSPAYKNFSEAVKEEARKKDSNFTYGEEEVNSFVGAFHDAVLLYAYALNETLANNNSITNGTEITRRMWNRTFEGITGNVSIDDNGDRNADYSLLDMNPETKKFEVVANYFGKDKEYKPEDGKKIHWAGNRDSPPPDTPKCGFDKSKCPPEKPFPEYGIVIIVLGSLLVIVLLAAFFIYRHIKLEAELAEMNWRVKWDDIMFGTMENDRKMRRQGSNISLTRTSNGDACSEGRVLIERTDANEKDWCQCGQCEATEGRKRVCCRQLELYGIFHEEGTCITSSEEFKDVVLNKNVLLAVFIHVMLVRRKRGSAPVQLNGCKLRLMATRQFLCWMHRGQTLKKESHMAVPVCVSRAIQMQFPDDNKDEHSSITDTSLTGILSLETETCT